MQPQGITVSPAFQQVQVLAVEPQHELDFTVTNHRPSAENIQLTTQDFNELADTGGLFFVGSNPTALQKKYGLATWLTLPQTSVVVQPQQTVKIIAYIRNDSTLAPGGHYGALMLGLSEGAATPKPNQVAVHPIASSLLFVNKVGGDIHSLKLTSVEASHDTFKLPSKVVLHFLNDGNTHVVPRGTVTITNPKGKLVSQGVINENSSLILPQVNREFTVDMMKVASADKAGKYKLTVNFRFDGTDQFRSYQTSILLKSPGTYLALAILLLIIVVFIVYYYKKIQAEKSAPKYGKKPKSGA